MQCDRRQFFRNGLFGALAELSAVIEKAVPDPGPPPPLAIDASRCFSALGSPCEVCVERCPLEPRPIRVALGQPPRVDLQSCDGCGVCAWLCPASALRARHAPAESRAFDRARHDGPPPDGLAGPSPEHRGSLRARQSDRRSRLPS